MINIKQKIIFTVGLLLVIIFAAIFIVKTQQPKQATIDPSKPSVGVLSIAMGRYNVLWKDFYESSEKYFLTDHKKHYFLFTDDKNIPYKDAPNVDVIYVKNVKWPLHALLKYDFFLSIKEKLKQYDYLYYFNMDLIFQNKIGDEILPDDKHDGLVFPAHYNHPAGSSNLKFPYERNPKSAAYIPKGQGKVYVPGGINGGKTKEFIDFCKYCSENTHKDLEKGIIAVWHDESYTNKYILDKNPLILPITYMYPVIGKEIYGNKYTQKDIKGRIRDKQKYGGRLYLRGQSNLKSTPFLKMKYWILSVFSFTKEKREANKLVLKRLEF